MKFFTLPTHIVKFLTGKTGRHIPFYTPSMITPIQKNKPVFMQAFFATIKKIFTVICNRYTFPVILNEGSQPASCCNTAVTNDLLPKNENHDVAQPAASFVFIPPAIDQTVKKFFMKAIVRKSGVFSIALTLFLITASILANAQVTSTAAGGVWGTGSTWVGGVVPTAGQNVVIATTGTNFVDIQATITQTGSVTVNSGATLTSTASGTHTVGSLIINAGGTVNMLRSFTVTGTSSISGTISFGSTSGTNRLMTFTGDVTLNSGSTWNETTTGAVAIFSFGGNFTNNATSFTAQNNATATHTFTGAAKTISGTTTTTFPYLVISGTTTNNGTLTVASILSGASTLTNGATGTLNIGGTLTVTTLNASTVGNTVAYAAAAGGQSVRATPYYNLNTNNTSGTETAAGNITVNGTLSTTAGGTLNMGTNTLTAAAANNSGTIRTQNTSATPLSSGLTWGVGTVNYDAAAGGQTIVAGSYGTLGLANTSGTQTAAGNITTNILNNNTNAADIFNMGTNTLSATTVNNTATIRTQNTSANPIPSGLTWGGTVTYNGSAAQTMVPGTFNNLIISNSAGATLSGAVSVSGVLTLTSGIINTTLSNLLSLTNTATTAISGGSATAYINGPLKWALAQNLSNGGTYNFQVGNTSYLPFGLVTPTTGASPITAQVQAFNGPSGGSFDGTITGLSSTEYWSLTTTGNFTNAAIALTNPSGLGAFNGVGNSTTQGGIYTSLGGNVVGNTVTSTANATGSGFFALATIPNATITTGLISGSPFCISSTIAAPVSVGFTSSGIFAGNNLYTAQLSDVTGSFAGTVTSIGSITSSANSGTINATIPAGTANSTTYRIRVVSSNPVVTSSDNGADLIIHTLPTAAISYAGNPFCLSNVNSQSVTQTGQAGGTYSATLVSGTGPLLAIDPNSGAITPSASNAGTYTVTYTFTDGTCSNSTTTSVTITTPPNTDFVYSQAAYCQVLPTSPSIPTNPSPQQGPSGPFVSGTFSATLNGNPTTDLHFVSTATGQIDLATSLPGVYVVTNTVVQAGCTITSTGVTVTINSLPTTTIGYAQAAYCKTDANAEPITPTQPAFLSHNYSGVINSGTGTLAIDANSGAITPSASDPGTYTVTLTFTNPTGPSGLVLCSNTTSTQVTITPQATGTISYANPTYCANAGIISITNAVTGSTTGAFYSASPAGLTISSTTGAVTTATSTTGIPYTVTYNVPAQGGCTSFSPTASIQITDTPVATISYGGAPLCTNGGVVSATITGPTGGTFASAPAGLSMNASGDINTAISTPGTYTVTYTTPSVNGCTGSPKTTVTIQSVTATPVLNTSPICNNTTTISITLAGEANGTQIFVRQNGVTVVTLARTTSTNYTIPAATFVNGGVITVTAQATGKCLSAVSNSVTVGPPAQPGSITGSNSVCPSTSGNAYSVTAVPGATAYTWAYSGTGATFTNGTTAAPTITFSAAATSGTLTVTANNTCGASAQQSMAITVNPGPPAAPGAITGPAAVCIGVPQTYSIASVHQCFKLYLDPAHRMDD